LYTGLNCDRPQRARRDPEDAFFVPHELWNDTFYPPYAVGGGYLLSADLNACSIQGMEMNHQNDSMVFPIEDAFVGILVQEGCASLQINCTVDQRFRSGYWFPTAQMIENLIVLHNLNRAKGIKGPELMLRMHKHACCENESIKTDPLFVRDSISCRTVVC